MSRQKPVDPAKTYKTIFRRYRTTRDGKVLDAQDYGYKAWPMTERQ